MIASGEHPELRTTPRTLPKARFLHSFGFSVLRGSCDKTRYRQQATNGACSPTGPYKQSAQSEYKREGPLFQCV
jgi:hypothetical protein